MSQPKFPVDVEAMQRIVEILKKVDNISQAGVAATAQELDRYQPVVLQTLIEVVGRIPRDQEDGLVRCISIIWEYFKVYPAALGSPITGAAYIQQLNQNIHRLEYLRDESEAQVAAVIADVFGQHQHRALVETLQARLSQDPRFERLNPVQAYQTLSQFLAIISCFEALIAAE